MIAPGRALVRPRLDPPAPAPVSAAPHPPPPRRALAPDAGPAGRDLACGGSRRSFPEAGTPIRSDVRPAADAAPSPIEVGASATSRGGPKLVPQLMLLTLGASWGLVVPLSAIAMARGADPFGLSTVVFAVGATIFLGLSILRGCLRRPSRPQLGYFALWAFASVSGESLLFFAARNVPASTISVIVILDGFMVFLLTALFRLDQAAPRQLAGLAATFAGLAVMLGFAGPGPAGLGLVTIAAFGVPLCYAAENILISTRWPAGVDGVLGLGVMQALAAAMGGLLVLVSGSRLPPLDIGDPVFAIAVAIGLCGAAANWLFQSLIKRAGSVFASQSSYVVTVAGIGWSVLLLGETLPPSLWIGVAAVLFGVSIVQPRGPRPSPKR